MGEKERVRVQRVGRRRRQQEPHIWDGVSQTQLDKMLSANEQLVAHIERAKGNLDFQGGVRLSAMENMQRARKNAGQSVKVEEYKAILTPGTGRALSRLLRKSTFGKGMVD